jgi:hypothetical protein
MFVVGAAISETDSGLIKSDRRVLEHEGTTYIGMIAKAVQVMPNEVGMGSFYLWSELC